MKRTVTITISIDPAEYEGVEDSPKGAVDLVAACLDDKADFSGSATIECGEPGYRPATKVIVW